MSSKALFLFAFIFFIYTNTEALGVSLNFTSANPSGRTAIVKMKVSEPVFNFNDEIFQVENGRIKSITKTSLLTYELGILVFDKSDIAKMVVKKNILQGVNDTKNENSSNVVIIDLSNNPKKTFDENILSKLTKTVFNGQIQNNTYNCNGIQIPTSQVCQNTNSQNQNTNNQAQAQQMQPANNTPFNPGGFGNNQYNQRFPNQHPTQQIQNQYTSSLDTRNCFGRIIPANQECIFSEQNLANQKRQRELEEILLGMQRDGTKRTESKPRTEVAVNERKETKSRNTDNEETKQVKEKENIKEEPEKSDTPKDKETKIEPENLFDFCKNPEKITSEDNLVEYLSAILPDYISITDSFTRWTKTQFQNLKGKTINEITFSLLSLSGNKIFIDNRKPESEPTRLLWVGYPSCNKDNHVLFPDCSGDKRNITKFDNGPMYRCENRSNSIFICIEKVEILGQFVYAVWENRKKEDFNKDPFIIKYNNVNPFYDMQNSIAHYILSDLTQAKQDVRLDFWKLNGAKPDAKGRKLSETRNEIREKIKKSKYCNKSS